VQLAGNRSILPILLILLLVAATRISGLNDFAVWTDEGWTVWATEHLTQVMQTIGEDRHPPLYFVSLALWEEVAGLSRLALRLPSAYSALITAALIWQIGRRVGGQIVGVQAALLFVVMPTALYYTREIRHFGWLMMMVTLSSWLFLRVLSRPTIARYTVYAVSIAVMMYTLYMGFFVVVTQVIVALFIWRAPLRDKAKFIGAWALALGLFAPWLYVIVTEQLALISVGIGGIGNVPETNLAALWALLRDLLGNGLPLLAALWLLALIPLRRVWRNPVQRTATLYILLWGMGTLLIMAAVNPFFTLFRLRTVTILLPGFILAVSLGLSVLPRRVNLIAFAVLMLFTGYRVLPIQPRGDMIGLAQRMTPLYQAGDLIVVETGWSDDEFIYEIRHELGWDVHPIRTLQWVDYRGENKLVVLEIERQLRAAPRVWVIHWNQPTQVVPWLDGDAQDYDQLYYVRHYPGAQLESYAGGYFARIDGGYGLYLYRNNSPTPPSGRPVGSPLQNRCNVAPSCRDKACLVRKTGYNREKSVRIPPKA
jgi:hypothetical protein